MSTYLTSNEKKGGNMRNKHGIQIIGNDQRLFGLDDVQLSQAEELQASRPVAIDRFTSLRDAFEAAIRSK